MENYLNLPLSNKYYQYFYSINDGEIIERNNVTGEVIAKLTNYNSFRDYYQNLNKRIVLPGTLDELFSSTKFLLAKNYIKDKSRIININENINYYLKIIDSDIETKRLKDIIYIFQLFNGLNDEISYQGSDKFEIPIIILVGEYFKALNVNAKWIFKEEINILGEKFFYPELLDSNEEYNLYDEVRKVLYNEKDDKIFNFRYLLSR
ncbi:hypothetical protein [Chryseobacterium sp. LAM-KRS1]|uniref:hypothetical protein n=1 Tax=Chryseobacterium sp. LAM-KRS1 TaxID=2715754 RepID=UPI001551BE9C|nr:hypothetical protein [Chryseobacterium sp. LAM-KRS1]